MKKLFALVLSLGFALGVSSCGGKVDENPDTSHLTRVAGKFELSEVEMEGEQPLPAEGAPYTLQLWVYNIDQSSSTMTMVATGAVSPDGVFSIDLPSAVPASVLISDFRQYLEDDEYTDIVSWNITMSDPEVKHTVFQGASGFQIVDKDGEYVSRDIYYNSDSGTGYLVYADRDCTISGSASFIPEDEVEIFKDIYDMNLRKGWNWVFAYDEGNDIVLRTKVPADARYGWGYYTE